MPGKVFKKIYETITQSLKYKLLFFFIMISVVPIILIGTLIYQFTSQIMVDRATSSSTDLIMKKISYFDEVSNEVNKILAEGTSSTDTIKFLNINRDNINLPSSNQVLDRMSSKFEYMLQMKDDFIDSVLLLPRKGYYPFFRGLQSINYVDDFSKLDIYKKTVNSKNLVLWAFEKDPEANAYYISASSSVIDGLTNNVIGVLAVYLDIKKIGNIFEHSGMAKGETNFVLDSTNTIIYHPDYSEIGKKYRDKAVLEKLEASPQGSFTQSINGAASIVTHYTSLSSGWRIINILPYDNISKDVFSISIITLAVSLVCLLYAFIIAVLFSRSIYNPIRQLTHSMRELGSGNLSVRMASKRTDEFGKLSEGFDSMIVQIGDLIENIRIEQKLKKETEIKALQSQITPHFLYNTLNCIKALIRAGRKEDSENMVTLLTSLLKLSLSNISEYVSVLEELNYVKSYIEIMEYRYEKKVKVTYDIDSSLLCCGILKFILQPIVENCFIHAFTNVDNDWEIKLKIFRNNMNMLVEVWDNGAGIDLEESNPLEDSGFAADSSKVKFSSIGLNNIMERIRLNYGEDYGLSIFSKLGKGTVIKLKLPYFEME